MGWVVEFLNRTVAAEVEALPNDMRAKFLRIVQLIEARGIEGMREPHVKHLDGRLWEMRMTGRDGISRAIYVLSPPGGRCGRPRVCQEDPKDANE